VILASAVCAGAAAAQAPAQTPTQAPAPTAAQTPAAEQPLALASAAVQSAKRSQEPFTLTYFNRPIVVLRAEVLGRSPAERASVAVHVLNDLVAAHVTEPVESRMIDEGALITLGSRVVVGIAMEDVDVLAGETLDGLTAQTVSRLQQAFAEANEAHTPVELLRAGIYGAIVLTIGILMLWGLAAARRVLAHRLTAMAESTVAKTGLTDLDSLRASRVLDIQRGLVTAVIVGLQLVVVYSLLSTVLELFPYTRPWGESLRGFLLSTVANLALGIVSAIPGLFTVVMIMLIARVAVRLVAIWFQSVEQGRVKSRWIYPETAQPTRRIMTTLVWVFAVVVAYPYMPGSGTDAFKGVSVFFGLMLTLGSSGLVNQIMSGFMVTYSRAVRLGDYVRIGETEGTVIHLGILSTKLRTFNGEEVTIPNAVVVTQTATDYSRKSETGGVFTPTSVTIGYDAPWRQVQAMLLLAAERTDGIQRTPKPYVLQEALQDFYVKYTLFVSLDDQERRYFILDRLHAHIQDLFNEYGVQIMSPNYLADPSSPKVVARKDWYASPARIDERAQTTQTTG